MRSTHPHPPGCLFRVVCLCVRGLCVFGTVCVFEACVLPGRHARGGQPWQPADAAAAARGYLGCPSKVLHDALPGLCVVLGMLRVPGARRVGLWQTGADRLWRAHAVVQACCVRGSAACSPVIDSHRAAVSVAGGAAQLCRLLLHWHARLWWWKDGMVVAAARTCRVERTSVCLRYSRLGTRTPECIFWAGSLQQTWTAAARPARCDLTGLVCQFSARCGVRSAVGAAVPAPCQRCEWPVQPGDAAGGQASS